MNMPIDNLAEGPQESNTPTPKSLIREIVEFVLLVLLIVVPFRLFIAEPYIVSGASMSPTYETAHYLIINKFGYKIWGIDRGDVLVFRSPTQTDKFFIKRAIALPGETIRVKSNKVEVQPVGSSEFILLDEPYTKDRTFANVEMTLGENEYFVMGDNRGNSYDSRAWGPLPVDNVRGTPVLRLFPFDLIGTNPGDEEFTF